MNRKDMPKVDLHCHFDGSLETEHICRMYGRAVDREELQIGENCESLAEYLRKFEIPLQCLQTAQNLEEAAYHFMKCLTQDNVVYVEVRFAPMLSTEKGLQPEEVLQAVLRGLEKGSIEYGIMYNTILCMMRHHKDDVNRKVIGLAKKYLGQGVCAVDLAGDEAAFPMELFTELFHEADKLGIPFTIHAGECGRAENVKRAVSCGAKRIGHGIAIKDNPECIQLCKEKGVVLEICPISNMHTKTVKTPADYPVRQFLDAGLQISINTDNRTVSNTSIEKEIEFLQANWQISDEEIWSMMQNGARAAFATPLQKEQLQKIFSLS